MKSRLAAVLGASVAILAGVLGCSSADKGVAAAGGASGGSGENLAGAANPSSAGGGSGGAPMTNSACVEHVTAQRTQGTVLSLAVSPTLAGKPFSFGQPNAMADGASLVPLNFRFYISEVQLLPSSGEPIAVDLVTPAGDPEPYGL